MIAKILLLFFNLVIVLTISHAQTTSASTSASNQADYYEFLRSETAIIDTLRSYITGMEAKISIIKSKTKEVHIQNEEANRDVEKYVSNPLHALTILKRYAKDWNALEKIASDILNNTQDVGKNFKTTQEFLKFPSEDDFDEALGNLLRLQDIYKLETKRLSVGELEGVKMGPEMSWSDCLEIGRKSNENGDYKIAKFWIETALGKLPDVSNNTTSDTIATTTTTTNGTEIHNVEKSEHKKARIRILKALLVSEFQMENFENALKIADDLLFLKPNHKKTKQAKATIEKTLKKESKRQRNKRLKKLEKTTILEKKPKKNAEATLIEEMCRKATIASTSESAEMNTNHCHLESGNLFELMLQPLKLEVLSHDPYIVIQHDVLNEKQIDSLKELIEEPNAQAYEEEDDEAAESNVIDLEFTNLAKQKLLRLNERLELQTGHPRNLFDAWQPTQRIFNNEASMMELNDFTTMDTFTKQKNIVANVLLNLQAAKLGGSLVFPQLELSVQVPKGALLYWSNLNEFQEVDYRIKHFVCPIISGTQITAVSTIRRA